MFIKPRLVSFAMNLMWRNSSVSSDWILLNQAALKHGVKRGGGIRAIACSKSPSDKIRRIFSILKNRIEFNMSMTEREESDLNNHKKEYK